MSQKKNAIEIDRTDFPPGWRVVKLSYFGTSVLGKMIDQKQETNLNVHRYLSNRDVGWFSINATELAQTSFPMNSDARYGIKDGDILICEGGEVGKCCVWRGPEPDFYFQKAIHRLRVDSKVALPEYIAYQIFQKAKTDNFIEVRKGEATISHLPGDQLIKLKFVLPSISVQEAIVSYLDKRCAAIDDDVTKRHEIINKLKEYKKSLIAHSVTKGLDPNATMKDSGVEWIGAVPTNWNVSPVWSVLKQRKESNEHGNQTFILSVVKDKGVIPYSQKGNVGNKAKEDLTGYMIARKGDIVFNSMNVIIGSVGLSDFDGAISPAYYAVYPASDSICIRYYDYIFQTRQFQYALRLIANGILEIRLKVNYRDFSHQKLPVPDRRVQEEIVTYLDERCTAIDEAIARQEQLIDKLDEYRRSIIHHAVTGKIDCMEG